MKKWLQRTVGTASLACGIALAATGIANAAPVLSDPGTTVGSLTPVTSTGAVSDLANTTPTDGMLPDATTLTGQVGDVANGLPGKKVVKQVTRLDATGDTTEALPTDGLPVVGNVTRGGLPVVGGNPITGGSAGQHLVDGVPVVGGMVGSAMNPHTVPGARTMPVKTEKLGLGSDLVGSKLLGKGAVGGLRGDVTRPAEDLPLVNNLPLVGQLGNAVPMGSTPLGVDKPGAKK